MPGGIHPPPEQWLAWPVPNYHNPTTRPPHILVLSCIIGPISILLLCTRLWVRLRMQRNAGVDDWLMLASLVPIMVLTVILPIATEKYRFNRHVWDTEPEYFPIQRKFIMVLYALFTLASGLVRLSVLLFYRRLSDRVISPPFMWIIRIMMMTIIGYTLAFLVVLFTTCRPFSSFWDQVNFALILRPEGYHFYCFNEGADVVSNAVIATAQDLMVATVPTILCWKLQISIRQKIALYTIFFVSYSTVPIGALRAWFSYRIYFDTYDVTWVANDTFMLSLLELHIGTMCANLPSLKIFFKQVSVSFNSRSSKSRSNGSSKKHPSIDPGTSAVSKSSTWARIAFWKRHNSRDVNGYVLESYTNFGIDQHGGIITTKSDDTLEDNCCNKNSLSETFQVQPVSRV